MRVLTFILILLSVVFKGYSQDSIVEKKEHRVTFNGYLKDMQTVYIHNLDETWLTSNLIHNRLNFKWNISNSFTFCLEE
jgi:hypothetical protein